MMYVLARYGNEWSVFDTLTRCHVLFGPKARMERRLKELNAARHSPPVLKVV